MVSAVHDRLISGATSWRVKARTARLEGGLLVGICAVVLQTCQLGSCCHDWVDEVGLIVVGYPLQDLHTEGRQLSSLTTAFSKLPEACSAGMENGEQTAENADL